MIEQAYGTLAQEVFVTPDAQENLYGFGCIAFHDRSCPNFPSFPIVTKLHYELFEEKIFPDIFVNQDADPFLFELYKRFDAAYIHRDLELTNTIGGHSEARYEKVNVHKGFLNHTCMYEEEHTKNEGIWSW
jgi:hypothetical protein